MLISSLTAAGSIREQNQDAAHLDRKNRLALLADGKGPDGNAAARCLLQHFASGLLENAFLFSAEEGQQRLVEFAAEAFAKVEAEYPASIDGFAAVWGHRGLINLLWQGKCLIAANRKFIGKPHLSVPGLKCASMSIEASDHFIMVSEGISAALNDNYLQNLLEDLQHRFSPERLQFFWNEAATRYDGDDRTIVAVRLEKGDISAGQPKEIVLFTDFDRQFSIPLWLPAAISAFFSMLGLFVARKMYKLLSPHFPQLKDGFKLLAALKPQRQKNEKSV